jgi:hypothetical protein
MQCFFFPARYLDDAMGTASPAAGVEAAAIVFGSAVMGAAGGAVTQGEGNIRMCVTGSEIISGDTAVMIGTLDDATGIAPPAAGIEVMFSSAVVMGAATGGAVPQSEGNIGIRVIGREIISADIVCDVDAAAISCWSVVMGMVTGPLGNVGVHIIGGCSTRWIIYALRLTLEH